MANTKVRPKEDTRNANAGTEQGNELLRESIERFGYGRSILLDSDDNIIAGNKTFKQAKNLGVNDVRIIETDGTELIAIKRTDLNLYEDPKARELAYADNRIAEINLNWDAEELLNDFRSPDLDIKWMFKEELGNLDKLEEFAGHDVDMDEQRAGQEFSIELPEIVLNDTIELYSAKQDHPHIIVCGDSCKQDTYSLIQSMVSIPIQYVITSPPYSNQRKYDGLDDNSLRPEHLSSFIDLISGFVEYAVVNLGIQIKDGVVNQYWDYYIQRAKQASYKILAWNVWDRLSPGSINSQTVPMFPLEHEFIFVFGKKKKDINRTIPCESYDESMKRSVSGIGFARKRDPDGALRLSSYPVHEFRKLPSVFRHSAVPSVRKYPHPAPYPVELPHAYILALSNEGEAVLDPFVGSGTTIAAAEISSRVGIGIDISHKNIATAIQQWYDAAGDDVVDVKINGESVI